MAMSKVERAFNQLIDAEHWLNDHGGDEAGYVERYGSKNDPEHYGDGGEAIFAADEAAYNRAYSEYVKAVKATSTKRIDELIRQHRRIES